MVVGRGREAGTQLVLEACHLVTVVVEGSEGGGSGMFILPFIDFNEIGDMVEKSFDGGVGWWGVHDVLRERGGGREDGWTGASEDETVSGG